MMEFTPEESKGSAATAPVEASLAAQFPKPTRVAQGGP